MLAFFCAGRTFYEHLFPEENLPTTVHSVTVYSANFSQPGELPMTVTIIATAPGAYVANLSLEKQKTAEDFAALDQSIQTGDVSTARFSLALFKKDIQIPTGSQDPFNNNPTIRNDIEMLESALTADDTARSQSAFASLKKDLQSLAWRGSLQHYTDGTLSPLESYAVLSTSPAALSRPNSGLLPKHRR
jgi:hypothetical protein